MKEYSTNKKAEKIVGKREYSEDTILIDLPWEHGFVCPKCKIEGENLMWSEYQAFLYCEKCNIDIPTCMCCPDIKKGTNIFLDYLQERLWN